MASIRALAPVAIVLAAAACTMPNPAFDPHGENVGDATGTRGGDGDGDSEGGGGSGESDDGGDPPPACGDGTLDEGEECDKGPDNDDFGECTRDCMVASCGDSFTQPGSGEACDLGLENGEGGVCRADCQLNECGDGYLGPGEACEVDHPNCTQDCTLPSCGNGTLDEGEQCDDGNASNDDTCTNACTLPVCGDGLVQADETCDDGNASNDDACLTTCAAASCGDGFIQTEVEECDLDNFGGKDCLDYDQIFGELGCDECTIDASGCKLCLPLGGACQSTADCCQDGIIAVCLGFTCVNL